MATITISKIKFRRGTNDQRQFIVLDQGEPAFTTDTKRLYVGTGTLSGGVVIGSKIHPTLLNLFSLSSLVAELYDIVQVNNKFYQLTNTDYTNINSWTDVSAKIDPIFFSYDTNNFITLNLSSISVSFIDPNTVAAPLKIESGVLLLDFNTKSLEVSATQLSLKESGIDEREISSTTLSSGLIGGSGSKIQVDFNTKSLEISANQISIKADGIDEREIAASTLSLGLTGGSGEKIKLDIDTNYLGFSGNQLTISNLNLQFSDLDPLWFGSGLFYDSGSQVITTTIQTVDNDSIQLVSGELSISPSVFGNGLGYDTTTSLLSTTVTDVDNTTLSREVSSGIISLKNLSATNTVEWPYITVDTYGRVTDVQSAVYDLFECDSSLNPAQSSYGPLSALFNGNPTGIINGGGNPNNITKFKVLSSDYATVLELSSAGFLVFQGNYTTRGAFADSIPRFAIPIFRF